MCEEGIWQMQFLDQVTQLVSGIYIFKLMSKKQWFQMEKASSGQIKYVGYNL